MMIKVGDTLYSRESWRRHVPEWRESKITGETKGTWTIGEGWGQIRVNKKTMTTAADRLGHKTRYYTEEMRDAVVFCEAHREHIAGAVRSCGDPEKLRTVAMALGLVLA
ncbi:hypothetical protein [Bradyrhizobium sp. RT10b]|uniref:hypothetical protein n=1 Tax=Bradyrhizobium sp. RT10b TaxID=3156331 RepID=UPI003398EDA5